MSDPRKLLLIDGSSYLYRAFHALPPLTTSTGQPTGAIFGFLNMLNRLRTDQQPDLIAVVMDAPGRTFRDDLYDEYKSNRPPMPDELACQIEALLEVVTALGLALLREPGVEADDVIGTLALRASAAGLDTMIATSDKDMAQIVSPRIRLVDTMTGRVLDPDGVKAKFGVPPERIADYLALVGDTSDNIPGVPGVGPRTAAKWLNEHHNLDGVVRAAPAMPGRAGDNLRECLPKLDLFRQLATIHCDLPLRLGPDDLQPGPPDAAALRGLYQRLELKNLLRGLPEDTAAEPEPPRDTVIRRYDTVRTREQLDAWLARLRQADVAGFDTETTSLNYMEAELVGLSFSTEPGLAAYVPVGHRYMGAPDQLDRDEVLRALTPWLSDPDQAKVGHHLKYDAHVLANHGIALAGMAHDSMLESYVLDSTATRHDLDSTSRKYLGVQTITYEEVAGKGASQIPFAQVPVDRAAEYAAEDADITLRLHRALWPRLQETPTLAAVYRDIEQPLMPVLLRMEEAGVLVDTGLLRNLSTEFAEKMAELETRAHREAGHPFTLSSPRQLAEVIYQELKLPVSQWTPTKQPSTNEDALQELAHLHPLPGLVLEYRALSKLKSTYTDKLPGQVCPRTGRIHTCYHQAVAATGRLSSSDPNLQNIPIRTEAGRRIRQAFIAREGYTLLAADYSQIELRIMAHISGDEGLLAAFAADQDIHQATAAEVFGTAPDQVTTDQRRSAKAINFGLIYGMSAFGLARQLGISREQAQAYVDLYFARYPAVKAYMDRTRVQAREQGYVETVFGRRLYLPDIRARQAARRQYAERSAINAPMQGTAADIIKRAMIAVDRWLLDSGADARAIMQVHDELVLEVRQAELDPVRTAVLALMTQAAALNVPLRVDWGAGPNWDTAH